MRGLGVSIFRNASIGDCTNGGITGLRYNLKSITLFDAADQMEGYIPPSDGPMLLVKRDKAPYLYAVPALAGPDGTVIPKPVPAGHVGWMHGGNLVSTSDSRFARAFETAAIPVHDRSEDYETYRLLSL